MRETRKRLARLREGADRELPDTAQLYFDRLREIGIDSAAVETERESWILMHAVFPEGIEEWARWQVEALQDPAAERLCLAMTRARDWSVEDPRIDDIVDQAVALTLRKFPPERANDDAWRIPDRLGVQLVNQHGLAGSPAWQRISEQVEARLAEAGYQFQHLPE